MKAQNGREDVRHELFIGWTARPRCHGRTRSRLDPFEKCQCRGSRAGRGSFFNAILWFETLHEKSRKLTTHVGRAVRRACERLGFPDCAPPTRRVLSIAPCDYCHPQESLCGLHPRLVTKEGLSAVACVSMPVEKPTTPSPPSEPRPSRPFRAKAADGLPVYGRVTGACDVPYKAVPPSADAIRHMPRAGGVRFACLSREA